MENSRGRRGALAGILFVVLAVASFAIGGETPDNDDSTIKVVAFWAKNDDKIIIASILLAIAALAYIWFGSVLREVIADAGDQRHGNLTFAGSVVAGTGLLIFAGLTFTAADTVGDVPGTVTQTIGVLDNDLFIPLAGGSALFYFAAGIGIVKTGVLPKWLGWVAIVLGVAAVTPAGFFSFLLGGIWTLVVSVILLMSGSKDGGSAPAAPAPPAPTA